MTRWIRLLAVAVIAGCAGESKDEAPPSQSPAAQRPSLLLSMGRPRLDPFWAEVERGARWHADVLGADLIVLAPRDETDVEGQIAQIEDQITKGIDAVLVAPADTAGLIPTLERARRAGIPVVLIGTDSPWPHEICFVGTDNRGGGRLAGRFLCERLPTGADVALVTGATSQRTHVDRAAGARAELARCGLSIVAEQPADSDRALARSVVENILAAHPDLAGLVAGDDLMALGAVEAARAMGRLHRLVIVGFDADPEAVDSIRKGEMSASVAPVPWTMGTFAVEQAVHHLAGAGVTKVVDSGSRLVTRETLAREE